MLVVGTSDCKVVSLIHGGVSWSQALGAVVLPPLSPAWNDRRKLRVRVLGFLVASLSQRSARDGTVMISRTSGAAVKSLPCLYRRCCGGMLLVQRWPISKQDVNHGGGLHLQPRRGTPPIDRQGCPLPRRAGIARCSWLKTLTLREHSESQPCGTEIETRPCTQVPYGRYPRVRSTEHAMQHII